MQRYYTFSGSSLLEPLALTTVRGLIVGGPAGSIDKECVHNTGHSLSIDPVGLPTINPRFRFRINSPKCRANDTLSGRIQQC